MQLPEIETARLILRQFSPRDLTAYAKLRSNPAVMKYIRDGNPNSFEQASDSLNNILRLWAHHGFGRWAIVCKTSNELIGWSGLAFLDTTSEIEIGAGLSPKYWGYGLIPEAVSVCLRFAFEELQLKRVVAVTAPQHTSAIKVLQKLGMIYVKTDYYYGGSQYFYEMVSSQFEPLDSLYILRRIDYCEKEVLFLEEDRRCVPTKRSSGEPA